METVPTEAHAAATDTALAGDTAAPTARTIGIQTLGCRLNQYESDGLMQKFVATGRYAPRALDDGPDIAILNTCTVTDQADARNRQAVRSIKRRNPRARVILTGCFAQTDPDKSARLPGVSLVVGNDRKAGLFDIVEELLAGEGATQTTSLADDKAPAPIVRAPADNDARDRPQLENPFGYGAVVPFGHTRAYLKIQDGCDRHCSYCKIPRARGRGSSRRLPEIIDELRTLEERGVPEVVLTGVNLGWYRDRTAGLRFAGLLECLLESLTSMRLRLSSIEPCDVDGALGELSRHPLFCDFLHVPLQSGSREVLKRMRRTYNPTSFRKRVEAVLKHNPDIFLGTDAIVGFPGESEADFAATEAVCRDLGMANIHAFRFSPRAGTEAAAFTERVRDYVVRQRMNRLADLKSAGWQVYAAAQIGQLRQAVVEHPRQKDASRPAGHGPAYAGRGLTDNFLKLVFDTDHPGAPAQGQLADFRLLAVQNDKILAEPVRLA